MATVGTRYEIGLADAKLPDYCLTGSNQVGIATFDDAELDRYDEHNFGICRYFGKRTRVTAGVRYSKVDFSNKFRTEFEEVSPFLKVEHKFWGR